MITGFFAELVTLGFWFWFVSIVETIIFVSLVCNRNLVYPILTLIPFFMIYELAFKINILSKMNDHAFAIALSIIIYFIGGIPWSFFRWNRFVTKSANIYKNVKRVWLESQTREMGVDVDDFKAVLVEKWQRCFDNGVKQRVDKFLDQEQRNRLNYNWDDMIFSKSPVASEYKSDLVFWIMYWPIDMFWMIFHDLIIDFGNNIYRLFSQSYQRISDNKFKDIHNDFSKDVDNS